MKARRRARRTVYATICCVGLSMAIRFAATACVDGATTTEVAYTTSWPSCDMDLVKMIWQGWGITDDSWNPAGITDACNEQLPFAKVMNAISLIEGAPAGIVGAFHQRNDYALESRANQTPYHDDIYMRFIENHGAGVEASSDAGDHTDLDCPIFDYPGTPTPNPLNGNADMLAERAAVIVHENWHHWQAAHGYNHHHLDGPQGSCTAGAGACDRFYPHTPGSALPNGALTDQLGALNVTNVVNNVGLYFHSAYQVMVEFEADIAIWGSSVFMPFAVRQEAQSMANSHLTTNFVNGAGFVVGTPVPFPTYVQR